MSPAWYCWKKSQNDAGGWRDLQIPPAPPLKSLFLDGQAVTWEVLRKSRKT